MKKSAFLRSKFVLGMRQILQVMKMGKMIRCPWGSFEVLSEAAGHKVKRIIVEPGGCLSLQLHHFRSEHWFVVAGSGDVTVGDKVISLSAGGSVDIPLKVKHRVRNHADDHLVIIEIQTGTRCDDSDIERFEDLYGRI